MFRVQAVYELLSITKYTSKAGKESLLIKLKDPVSDRYETYNVASDFDVSKVTGVRLVKATWKLTNAFGKPNYYFLESLTPYSEQKKN